MSANASSECSQLIETLQQDYSRYLATLQLSQARHDFLARTFAATVKDATDADLLDTHQSILQQFEAHAARRALEDATELARQSYTPLHPEVYTFSPAMLDPGFLAAFAQLQQGRPQTFLANIVAEECGNAAAGSDSQDAHWQSEVYSFPLFRKEVCDQIADEIAAFLAHLEARQVPVQRPNSMNKYGLIMRHMGMTAMMDSLLTLVIKPLAAMLFPHRGGATIDSQHSFIAAYKVAPSDATEPASASASAAAALSHADHGHALSLHTDDAEVTLNVCIGRDFQGGDLYFYGHPPAGATSAAVARDQRPVALVSHRVGRALLHAGGNRHGARPITAGERSNLIIWCRSSQLRSAAVAMEEPDSEAP